MDEPTGWRCHLMLSREKVTGEVFEPYQVDFMTKNEAILYKKTKQVEGWIATVTPIFLSPQQRGKLRKKGQIRTAPPGFNRDWRLG